MKKAQSSIVKIRRYADMFSAIGAEPRLRILQMLLPAGVEGLTVTEIQSSLRIPGSTLSHHLDKLKQEDLIRVRREGTFLRYAANAKALQEVLAFLYADCERQTGTRALPARL